MVGAALFSQDCSAFFKEALPMPMETCRVMCGQLLILATAPAGASVPVNVQEEVAYVCHQWTCNILPLLRPECSVWSPAQLHQPSDCFTVTTMLLPFAGFQSGEIL